MATKKSKPKAVTTSKAKAPVIVARPRTDDELLDEDMLVDASGTFRAVSTIQQAQTGHDEESTLRFASDSLVMRAQRDGFRETGTTPTDAADETAVDDESGEALKRQRLATLAARNQARTTRRR